MKRSIKRQLILIIAGTVAVSFIITALINNFFLEKYYEQIKTAILTDAYYELNSIEKSYDSQSVMTLISENASKNNLQYVVADGDLNTIFTTSNASGDAGSRLFGYCTGLYRDNAEVLSSSKALTLQKTYDMYQGLTYLEIWGKLDNGNYYLIRTPMESIKMYADITNSFFLYIGITVTAFAVVTALYLSGRFTKPITELTKISEKMADMDFETRYTARKKRGNEIDELGEHFNIMSDELERKISELRTANALLEKDNEYISRVAERRREFINNVSHELKTPIAVIQGYAEGLKENIADDEESRQYYYDVILDESIKMNKLVKQLMDLDAIESGNEVLDIKRFDLTELISYVIRNMQVIFESNGSEVSFSDPGPLYVMGDEFRIEEVLTNYLNNAVHHADESGKIAVSAEETESTVIVRVFNSGKPIPEEDLPRIWDKFYKVDKARTRAYGGSGIGLSIVKAIMDSHNGRYGAVNREDGVEFYFELEKA